MKSYLPYIMLNWPIFVYFAAWYGTGWTWALALWLAIGPAWWACVWKRDFGYWQFWRDL